MELFPTRIWAYHLAALLPCLPDWKEMMDRQRAGDAGSTNRSVRNGWSGPRTLLEHKQLRPLRKQVDIALKQAFAEMGLPDGFAYRLESWGNVHDKGGYNVSHIHRDAILSGCFYVHVPPGSGALCFHDPRPAVLYSTHYGQRANSYGRESLVPKPASLILFPGWLEHSVEPNQSDESRYAIALNAVPLHRPPAGDDAS